MSYKVQGAIYQNYKIMLHSIINQFKLLGNGKQ